VKGLLAKKRLNNEYTHQKDLTSIFPGSIFLSSVHLNPDSMKEIAAMKNVVVTSYIANQEPAVERGGRRGEAQDPGRQKLTII
jgi:hypothetical protein